MILSFDIFDARITLDNVKRNFSFISWSSAISLFRCQTRSRERRHTESFSMITVLKSAWAFDANRKRELREERAKKYLVISRFLKHSKLPWLSCWDLIQICLYLHDESLQWVFLLNATQTPLHVVMRAFLSLISQGMKDDWESNALLLELTITISLSFHSMKLYLISQLTKASWSIRMIRAKLSSCHVTIDDHVCRSKPSWCDCDIHSWRDLVESWCCISRWAKSNITLQYTSKTIRRERISLKSSERISAEAPCAAQKNVNFERFQTFSQPLYTFFNSRSDTLTNVLSTLDRVRG